MTKEVQAIVDEWWPGAEDGIPVESTVITKYVFDRLLEKVATNVLSAQQSEIDKKTREPGFWLSNILRTHNTEEMVNLHKAIGERIPTPAAGETTQGTTGPEIDYSDLLKDSEVMAELKSHTQSVPTPTAGKPISRDEVLRISRETMDTAERERTPAAGDDDLQEAEDAVVKHFSPTAGMPSDEDANEEMAEDVFGPSGVNGPIPSYWTGKMIVTNIRARITQAVRAECQVEMEDLRDENRVLRGEMDARAIDIERLQAAQPSEEDYDVARKFTREHLELWDESPVDFAADLIRAVRAECQAEMERKKEKAFEAARQWKNFGKGMQEVYRTYADYISQTGKGVNL